MYSDAVHRKSNLHKNSNWRNKGMKRIGGLFMKNAKKSKPKKIKQVKPWLVMARMIGKDTNVTSDRPVSRELTRYTRI
jgi:hypothetical protein